MKIFRDIVKHYFKKNKTKIITFISSCSLLYITNVIFLSKAYSAFLNPKNNTKHNIRNVCIVWIFKFTLSLIKSQLERNIIPEFLYFIRQHMFSTYLKKNEIDLTILNKFLNVLQMIENGEVDQHEGSFMVGTLLKEIYVDSALRKAEKLNENEDVDKPVLKGPQVNITWKQFKLGEP